MTPVEKVNEALRKAIARDYPDLMDKVCIIGIDEYSDPKTDKKEAEQ